MGFDWFIDHYWLVVGYSWVTWATFGFGLGQRQDRGGLGLLLAALLGPLGVAVLYAVMESETSAQRRRALTDETTPIPQAVKRPVSPATTEAEEERRRRFAAQAKAAADAEAKLRGNS